MIRKRAYKEHVAKLRKVLKYEDDVRNIFNSENIGLMEYSIFNRINNFHILENFYCDLLHDILEGVLKYDISHILLHFIKNNIFDIELLNIRK